MQYIYLYISVCVCVYIYIFCVDSLLIPVAVEFLYAIYDCSHGIVK